VVGEKKLFLCRQKNRHMQLQNAAAKCLQKKGQAHRKKVFYCGGKFREREGRSALKTKGRKNT